jgi:hypothetical protein
MGEKDVPLVKAVIHLADKTIVKGYLKDTTGTWSDQGAASAPLPEEFELGLARGGSAIICLSRAKAVFFVREFQGQSTYDELRFFRNVPEFPGLWVRLRFADDEITEGLVYNSLPLLTDRGFFLKPPDPKSNNKMVYALKKHLVDFQVLGVKSEC